MTNRSAQHVTQNDGGALMFFNDHEARTIESVTERLIPGDDETAGAASAGVVYYIDRSVAGFSRNLKRIYRLGLRELDEYTHECYSASFTELGIQQQDEVVTAWLGPPDRPQGEDLMFGPGDQAERGENDRHKGNSSLLLRLFAVLREHTVEGFFCDPVYGGNRDAVGWRLVGFPGAQWGYTEEQMQPGFDATSIIVKSLSDLRNELANPPDNATFSSSTRK